MRELSDGQSLSAPLGRPQGEVRLALQQAAVELARDRGHFSKRDVAEHAQVGYRVAAYTVNNMARAGELVPVGVERRAKTRRWVRLYEPASEKFAPATTGASALVVVMRGWGRK